MRPLILVILISITTSWADEAPGRYRVKNEMGEIVGQLHFKAPATVAPREAFEYEWWIVNRDGWFAGFFPFDRMGGPFAVEAIGPDGTIHQLLVTQLTQLSVNKRMFRDIQARTIFGYVQTARAPAEPGAYRVRFGLVRSFFAFDPLLAHRDGFEAEAARFVKEYDNTVIVWSEWVQMEVKAAPGP
jgi:hypothetical protein